jgi:hypothetical protein
MHSIVGLNVERLSVIFMEHSGKVGLYYIFKYMYFLNSSFATLYVSLASMFISCLHKYVVTKLMAL